MPHSKERPEIAIAGAGIAGAYLFRLLQNQGREADLFDVERTGKCGLTPCAWGTSRGFCDLVKAAGLEPNEYILRRVDHLIMDEVKIQADLMTIDKPRLIKDLLQGKSIKTSPLVVAHYHRVIDATGVTRAFLPPIDNDIILPCKQFRVKTTEELENQVKLGGIGYSWCFPLAGLGYHLGCGSFLEDPQEVLKQLDWLGIKSSRHPRHVVCECEGKVRLTSPHGSLPFVTNQAPDGIWGVGEAIGCVAPLAGDGIVPGMRSAQILMDKWNDASGYAGAILEEFRWMKEEREVVDKLIRKVSLGMNDAWVLKRNSRRMGMKIGIREATRFMKRLK